ncbi:hypothetical protein Daura_05610 [Dactylosporangium aurantiacum]|uniref:Secreted protein n=1 Tax=Dactylosporangium aurantiacum TaxID=35754 RepID=A0A9Q9IGL8_9ACTN|nr:hypothetical protein [Dactylosporangium aurantiacum]MDG6104755.1 hypothetical protein [Dactylosporangium aurantiacum]UWZ55682.1 hypothetical protein Daura_05610 [Dactylosporangium aurantiacum]
MRILKRLLVTATAVVIAVAMTPAAAKAYDTAWHRTNQYLVAYPTYANDPTCVTIPIELAEGTYELGWDWEFGGSTVFTGTFFPTVHLEHAWYTWQNCLYPKSGFYLQTVTLTSQYHPNAPVTSQTPMYPSKDGIWRWGSYLAYVSAS